jgi:phage-related protein
MAEVRVVFFRDEDGVPLLDWLARLKPPKAVAKCGVLVELLRQFGNEMRRPHADYLRDGIYELRTKLGRVRYRMLYFFHGRGTAVLTHGFTKQTAKVPPGEIDRAVKFKALFEADPDVHTHEEE